jgi:hypothetical protein
MKKVVVSLSLNRQKENEKEFQKSFDDAKYTVVLTPHKKNKPIRSLLLSSQELQQDGTFRFEESTLDQDLDFSIQKSDSEFLKTQISFSSSQNLEEEFPENPHFTKLSAKIVEEPPAPVITVKSTPSWYSACRTILIILLFGAGIYTVFNVNHISGAVTSRLAKFSTSYSTPWPLSTENRNRFRKSFSKFLDDNKYSILTNRTFKYLETYRGDFPLSMHFVGDKDVETKVISIYFF